MKRNSGVEYVNTLGRIIPAKNCNEYDCKCRLKCWEKITLEQRRQNFERFYSNASWETQTAILISSIKVTKVGRRTEKHSLNYTRNYTRLYYLRADSIDIEVCKVWF